MKEEYINATSVASMLGISYPTLMRRKRDSEEFPQSLKKGNKNKLYWKKKEIGKYLLKLQGKNQ